MNEWELREKLCKFNSSEEFLGEVILELDSVPEHRKKGRSRGAVLASIAYRKLVEKGVPILADEVREEFGVEERSFSQARANVKRLLDRFDGYYVRDRLASIYERNKDILDRHSPPIIVATCIYLTGNMTQREASCQLHVTEARIRKVLRELERR